MEPSMSCALFSQINKQYWPRVTLSLNHGDQDGSALRGWRHALLRGFWWLRMFTMTLDLAWWSHCIMWSRRGVGPSCWTQEQWCWSPLRREARAFLIMGVLNHSRDPWRDCVEVLLLRISRKCNQYSCSLLKIPCISDANGVSFPGDTDPS